jgi:hypothetical protein
MKAMMMAMNPKMAPKIMKMMKSMGMMGKPKTKEQKAEKKTWAQFLDAKGSDTIKSSDTGNELTIRTVYSKSKEHPKTFEKIKKMKDSFSKQQKGESPTTIGDVNQGQNLGLDKEPPPGADPAAKDRYKKKFDEMKAPENKVPQLAPISSGAGAANADNFKDVLNDIDKEEKAKNKKPPGRMQKWFMERANAKEEAHAAEKLIKSYTDDPAETAATFSKKFEEMDSAAQEKVRPHKEEIIKRLSPDYYGKWYSLKRMRDRRHSEDAEKESWPGFTPESGVAPPTKKQVMQHRREGLIEYQTQQQESREKEQRSRAVANLIEKVEKQRGPISIEDKAKIHEQYENDYQAKHQKGLSKAKDKAFQERDKAIADQTAEQEINKKVIMFPMKSASMPTIKLAYANPSLRKPLLQYLEDSSTLKQILLNNKLYYSKLNKLAAFIPELKNLEEEDLRTRYNSAIFIKKAIRLAYHNPNQRELLLTLALQAKESL